MSVPFNDPFDPFYSIYSVPIREFSLPDHIDRYLPVNQDDERCVSILVPSPERGAKIWTQYGKWITIGVYKDEGRDPAFQPATTDLSWIRSGNTLTVYNGSDHKLRVGDRIDLFNFNITPMLDFPVSTVSSSTSFTIQVPDLNGVIGGDGAWQKTVETNFAEENYVFRLLPSFKLVPYELILQIFEDSSPEITPPQRSIYNITSSSEMKLPTGKSRSINYDTPGRFVSRTDKLPLSRRFNQAYDESGTPIPLKYLDDGFPKPIHQVDSPYKNEKLLFNQPVQQEIQYDDDIENDERIYIYDFYGLDLNDNTRGPHYASDIIQSDPEKSPPRDNIYRKTNNTGDPLYSKKLYDNFGNMAIGIQETNAVLSKVQILPISLDAFNRPIGTPVKRKQ